MVHISSTVCDGYMSSTVRDGSLCPVQCVMFHYFHYSACWLIISNTVRDGTLITVTRTLHVV